MNESDISGVVRHLATQVDSLAAELRSLTGAWLPRPVIQTEAWSSRAQRILAAVSCLPTGSRDEDTLDIVFSIAHNDCQADFCADFCTGSGRILLPMIKRTLAAASGEQLSEALISIITEAYEQAVQNLGKVVAALWSARGTA